MPNPPLRFPPAIALFLLLLTSGCGGTPSAMAAQELHDFSMQGWTTVGPGTTGGAGGRIVAVSTPEGLVSHLQREEPLIILVDGEIDLSEEDFPGAHSTHSYLIASNKSIIGLGNDAAIRNGNLRLSEISNVIIRNLTFSGSHTAIAVTQGTERVWIDHNDFTNCEDGLIDITNRANFVTVSWNRFFQHGKVSLVGSGDDRLADRGLLSVTYHHNWFEGTSERHPRVRFGKVHLYNNLYDNVSVGVGIGVEAQIISESNFFRTSSPYLTYHQDAPDRPGFMRDTGSAFTQTDLPPMDDSGIAWSPGDHYSYTLLDLFDVPQAVKTGAGVGVIATPVPPASPAQPEGLIAFYPLTQGSGTVAEDLSLFDPPLDLTLSGEVSWLSGGRGLRLAGGMAKLQSEGAATKLYDRITQTRQFTVEIWAKPARLNQEGPTRLISYSLGSDARNFTLAHGMTPDSLGNLMVRIRTSGRGDSNGLPDVVVPRAIINGVSHYVCTYDGKTIRTYRNGELIFSESREGFLDQWDPAFPLVVGNETSDARGWEGEIYGLAIFDRKLTEPEILERFELDKEELKVGEYSGFFEWREYAFPELDLTNPALAGPAGDAGGCGVPNLFRYKLGLDPLHPTPGDVSKISVSFNPNSGAKHLEMAYQCRTDHDDVLLTVEASNDLIAWEPIGEDGIVSSFQTGPLEMVTIRDPLSLEIANQRFMRLRATLLNSN